MLSLYNVIRKFISRLFDVGCALSWTISSTLSIPYFPVVLFVGLMPPGLPSVHYAMSIAINAQFIFRQSWSNALSKASDITRRHSITADFLILRFWQSLCPLFNHVYWALDVGIVLYLYPLVLGSTPLNLIDCCFLKGSPSVAKRSVLEEGWGLYLPVSLGTHSSNVVRYYINLVEWLLKVLFQDPWLDSLARLQVLGMSSFLLIGS